ncbi:MAG: hypothetical protein KI793_08295 [Rivularia sp. (in: Bacteria)]|nr:hypothetical protein [Rivularia sp. MS3]
MPSGKQILIEKLFHLSLNEINEKDEKEISDIITAALLLHGSHTPDNFECVTNIYYRKSKDSEYGTGKRQGIFIDNLDEFISDFIYELAALETVPKEIKEKYPSISKDEFWSILHTVNLVLRALEWNSTDAIVEQVNDDKSKEKLLKSSIRDLNFYRENKDITS